MGDQAGREIVCGIVAPKVACSDSFSALLPYNVMGDGNCCLHAISVALWGIQDRVGVLRGALNGMMNSKELFWRLRWTTQEKEWDGLDAVSEASPFEACAFLGLPLPGKLISYG